MADFAREHGKGLSIPEWGLASPADGGLGDNPFYIEKMRSFFEANADVLVLESYFSEPETSLGQQHLEPGPEPAVLGGLRPALVRGGRWLTTVAGTRPRPWGSARCSATSGGR